MRALDRCQRGEFGRNGSYHLSEDWSVWFWGREGGGGGRREIGEKSGQNERQGGGGGGGEK